MTPEHHDAIVAAQAAVDTARSRYHVTGAQADRAALVRAEAALRQATDAALAGHHAKTEG